MPVHLNGQGHRAPATNRSTWGASFQLSRPYPVKSPTKPFWVHSFPATPRFERLVAFLTTLANPEIDAKWLQENAALVVATTKKIQEKIDELPGRDPDCPLSDFVERY